MPRKDTCHLAGASRPMPAPRQDFVGHSRPVAAPTEDDLFVANRIRAHMRREMHERHITKAELARKLEADDGNVGRILNGGRGIGLALFRRICGALDLNPTRVLRDDPPPRFWDIGSESFDPGKHK